ncbi:MAG: ABC transporter substrate-binding protein [Elusimicrobiales bacterium]|nr:ABC transporter substrate-binding protein [Elusimicrobiales bacterium]
MNNNIKKSIRVIVFGLIGLIFALPIFLYAKKKTNTITIGAILPLTGKQARYGQYIKQAIDLAVEEINQQGGINGKKLSIIYEDDQAEPTKAANIMLKFASFTKVPIVFGSWASSCVLAQAPIAEKYKIPILAEAQSPKIRYAGDYVFRIQPDTSLYIKKLVPYVFQQLSIKKIAIVYVTTEYGLGAEEKFRTEFENLGGKVIYSEGFPQNTTDFRNIISKLKNLSIDAIYIPAMVETSYFIKQAKEFSVNAKIIAGPPIESQESIEIAGNALEGVIYPHHFDPDSSDSLVRKFISSYQKKYNEAPEGYAALAYDAIYVIAKVLKESGEDREKIKNNLYKATHKGVTGLTSFDEYGDVVKDIVIRSFKNGKFTTIWTQR